MTDDFASLLLAWWDAHGRKDLPWQQDRTPYRVWVSEVMLQQTTVRAVVPYFERFTARFPDVAALADASLDEVLHLWSGLGYYARARNLHQAARVVALQHGGVFPHTQEAIEALPGIGRSTAGAIVALAYNRRAAILDGNVKRVIARQHRIGGPITRAATLAALWQWAEAHTPSRRARDYTQAIMDLGATVCRRRNPLCDACPVRSTCAARALGDTARYPVSAASRRRRLERRRYFVLTDPAGRCFVERRPPSGLWGGLWSPPERPAGESATTYLDAAGIDPAQVESVAHAPAFRHAFSHFDLEVEPVYVRLGARPLEVRDGGGTWIDPADHRLGLSAVAARILAASASMELSRDP